VRASSKSPPCFSPAPEDAGNGTKPAFAGYTPLVGHAGGLCSVARVFRRRGKACKSSLQERFCAVCPDAVNPSANPFHENPPLPHLRRVSPFRAATPRQTMLELRFGERFFAAPNGGRQMALVDGCAPRPLDCQLRPPHPCCKVRSARRVALCRHHVARVQFAQHFARSRRKRAVYDAVKGAAPLFLFAVFHLSGALPVSLEEIGIFLPDSSIPLKEIHISSTDLCISSREISISFAKICISIRNLHISFFRPSQGRPLQKTNSLALPVKLRAYANARYARSRLPRPCP